MTISERMAAVALECYQHTTFESKVINVAKLAILDQYGLQIAGSEFPWSRSIYQYTIDYLRSNGHSTITRFGDFVSANNAAFINSCFAHAQDFDDSHQEAQTHPGSVVIPAAIAIGEELALSGEIILKAIIIGMEMMLRLAHSLCPACIEGGHHTPPTIGPFGSAIATGLLLGLNEQQLVNALGICGSMAGGLVEYTLSGGSVKRIHTGLGARSGLEAALLAKEGLTGPATVIEGKKGIWHVFGRGKAFPDRLFDQWGEKFMLSTLMFKPYNCCYLIHPAIQGFLSVCQSKKILPEDIQTVRVGLSAFSISHAGIIQPKDILGAQFSTSFTLALALIKEPPSMHTYTEDTLTNPKILNLANKIKIYKDMKTDSEFPKKNGCIITIQTIKGEQHCIRVTDPKGSPDNPLTKDEVRAKYFNNVNAILEISVAEDLCETLLCFDTIDNIQSIKNFFK